METTALSFPTEAAAQPVFGFGAWGGEVELGYERERQETRAPGSPDIEVDRTRYNERLGIRNNGFYLLDPRLVTGNLGFTVDFVQEQTRLDGQETTQDGKLTGYAFDTGFFLAMPYSASLFANRNQNLINHEFGGRSEITYENHGASFRLREDGFLKDAGIPYFSSIVGVRQERTREGATVLGNRFQRDEQRNAVSLEANKGFETADLGLHLEATDVEDRARPGSAFETRTTSLTYSLDFGPTLNRRWDSRVYYFDRTNGGRNTFVTLDERLRLDHHENLTTDYRYLLARIEVPSGETATHTGTVHAQQRLYRDLTTDYTLQGQRQELPDGERTQYAGQLDLNYQRTFRPERRVYARLGGRHQIDDNDLATSRIDVVDEPHAAPSPLGAGAGFTLANPFVIASTIVVVDARGGGRLPTTLGIDYDVVVEGDLTKIVPLPTSPVIQAGDPLLVSYAFQVAPNIRFSTASWWLGGGIDFRWIAVSVLHEQSDQTLLSGQDERFLEDRRTDTAQFELRGDWGRTQARANAAYQAFDSTRLEYTRLQYGEFLYYRPRFDLVLGLAAEQSFTDFALPVRASETRSVRATLDWFAPRGWYITVFAGTRTFEDSELPTETVHEAGARGRRIYGKLEVAPAITWSDRRRGEVEITDTRFDLRAIRRF